MRTKNIIGMLTALSMTFPMFCIPQTNAETKGTMRDMTTAELVKDMGIGINLGNTLEACGDWIAEWSDCSVKAYETAWGSPVVTKEMIQGMADEGFGVLRIPVAWSNRMVDDGKYTIDKEWMERVTQVVDWTLESNMYAIINIHWDNGWVNKFPDNKDESMKRFQVMWEQISDNFKDYGDRLMFESQNEELGWESLWNPWGGTEGKAESYALCNEINQKFVDVVRKSGGNNDKRHLLISGYNTGIDRVCDPLFKMPDDPANRMAISVHYYTPAGFAILEDKDESWAKARSTWGTADDYKELDGWMEMMKTNYADKGIPVIIGEYGCPTKGKEQESVRKFLSSVCKAAYDRGLCPVLWSTPGGHYDRETFKLANQELKAEYDKITGGKKPAQVSESTTTTTSATTTSTTTTETTTTTTAETTTTTTTVTETTTSETTTLTTTTAETTASTTSAAETTTAEITETTAVSTEEKKIVWGDANCDDSVSLADAVLIMQAISNPDKYSEGKPDGITAQGVLNGDVYENGTGLTSADALSIQKYKLQLIKALPESYKK